MGMPLSEARSLLNQTAGLFSIKPGRAPPKVCSQRESLQREAVSDTPRVYFFPHDVAADRAALEQLAFSCESLSPYLGLEVAAPLNSSTEWNARVTPSAQPPEPESLLLEVSSVAHLCGGESGLWAIVQRHFGQRGYCVQAAIADTIGAAWAAAHWIARKLPLGKSFCPATDAVLMPHAPGIIPSSLSLLPVAALRLIAGTLDLLQQLGIERIEQLRQIPRGDLRTRFGDEMIHRLDQLAGTLAEVIPWLSQPVDFYAQQFLDFPTTDRATIDVILSRLVGEICRQMQTHRRGAATWNVRLYSPESAPLQMDIQLFQPTSTPREVLPLIQMQLEQQGIAEACRGRRNRPKVRQEFSAEAFSVHHISIRIPQSMVLIDRQRLLFDDSPRLDTRALACLINGLSTRLGADKVVVARLQPEAQAELAFRFEPLVGAGACRPTEKEAKTPTRQRKPSEPPVDRNGLSNGNPPRPSAMIASPLQRPLRLFSPVEIAVRQTCSRQASSADLPATCPQSPPIQLTWERETFRITRAWGAERIETGWWRGPTVRRDYWRVELADGRWLWIFYDLAVRKWYVHGEF